jgi:hypothetical protein
MKYLLWLLFIIITIGLLYTSREGFITKGIQLDQHFDIPTHVSRIKEKKPKYIVIIPYLGMNALNVYIEKINSINKKKAKVHVFAVDDVDIATDFFSQLCSTPLSLPSAVPILLTQSKGEKPYIQSTEIVLPHQLKKLLQKIKG